MLASIRSGTSLLRSSLASSSTAGARIASARPAITRLSEPLVSTPAFRTYATEIAGKKNDEVAAALSRTASLFKTYKPITPGIRHLKRPINDHIYSGRPVRLLTFAKRKTGGRNRHGKITVRHLGGGHRQRIRTLDFKREEPGIYDVVRIEYDPGRSSHIALVKSRNPDHTGTSKWKYIIATEGMRAGDEVQSFRQGIPDDFIPGFKAPSAEKDKDSQQASEGEDTAAAQAASAESLALGLLRTMTLKPGNVLPLRLIPPGTVVHNVALKPHGPGILIRSAGTFGVVIAHEEGGRYTHVRLQSGEVRKVLQECCATVGKVSNPLWKNRVLGKAGRARWLGIRPTVRGVAMNAYVLTFHIFLFTILIIFFLQV
jgi:ribosomal protein L2